MYAIDVKDAVCVITGASSGNGLAMAGAFLECGAIVYGWDIQENPSGASFQEKFPGRFAHCQVDVSDEGQVAAAAGRIAERFGKLDVLINNAGIIKKEKVEDSSTEVYDRLYKVNILGTVLPTKHLTPLLKKSAKGRIINLSSIQAAIGMETYSPYTFTKAAISGLTRVWAAELAPYGVTVNALCPGWVDTPMKTALIKGIGAVHGIGEEEAQEKILGYVPQHRFIDTSEIAFAALFLASPLAKAISGTELFIDTGLVHAAKPGLPIVLPKLAE